MARFLFWLWLLPGTAWGAAQPPSATVTGSLRLLAGLAVVAGLILAGYAALRRFGHWWPKTGGSAIRIRETRPLGPKKSLCVVEVQDRQLLLGITAERITLLESMPARPDSSFAATLEKTEKEQP